ncbi:general transcription factor IIH subunit 2-like isoform X1 [Lethenteron reissneri]|uniref:general transcription factor IIH subunit 2-like isoform X1 n=1 Tax=Lethenteron reissneri TaxID=7753 RepID=UPI002AB73303|nr:general transcription factor IIH subunit 2-like isoform X1 [Lethenteron reissneri]
MMEEEPERAKRWEGDYERTWEVLKEDESGSLKASVDDLIFQAKRRKVSEFHGQVRLGMMRHLFVVVDMSRGMEDQDLKPNRLTCSLKLLEHFVEEYFYQNPISQVGLITTKNKRAEKLTELGGTPKKHITALKKATQSTCLGEPSLYNSLQLAMETLKHMPSHTSREILVVFGSLTTCDPANIYDLIQTLKAGKVRVSIIGLSAEVHVCTALTKETGGSYHVILDESHFKELLLYHVTPPPVSANMDSSLIRMGSWRVRRRRSQVLSVGGFFCPQCRAKYCELPVECKVCGLTLVSAPHLARSYHHLFPLDAFQEQPLDKFTGQRVCEGCQVQLKENSVFMCSLCARPFCLDCDLFIHETLHCCPGCVHSDKQNT